MRAWYRRFYSAELGVGAGNSRIRDILKGYGRAIDQPPPMERIGCAPADLARGMDIALAMEPDAVCLMWRAALTLSMSAMARAVELALDAGRAEAFEETQHMTARDVAEVRRRGMRHAAVQMRKRKNLQVLRGKDHTVIVAAGGKHFDTRRPAYSSGWRRGERRASATVGRCSATRAGRRSRRWRWAAWCAG